MLVGVNAGIGPAGWMISSDGGAGSLNWRSKTPRSCLIVGEPKLSTITIDWPLPSMPERSSGLTE